MGNSKSHLDAPGRRTPENRCSTTEQKQVQCAEYSLTSCGVTVVQVACCSHVRDSIPIKATELRASASLSGALFVHS